MKKIISRILIVALMASLLMTVFATAAMAGSTIYITGDSVYVRKGPGKDYAERGTVHYRDSFTSNGTATDERGVTWHKINYKGSTGWVSSKYTSTSDPGGKASGKIYATGGSTYVRASYNKNSKILTSMPQGASATYLGTKKKDSRGVYWYNVKYNGKVGWVSSRYTSTTPGGGGSGKKSGTVVATGGSTYIRSTYNKEAPIITSMSKGATVYYLGVTKKDSRGVAWYKVETKSGKVGWVSSKFTTRY